MSTFNYRMRDLEQRSKLPASSIRFFLKEGLLPEPERPTQNSALYGEPHVEALRNIKHIKRLAPELPIAQIRRIIELTAAGVPVEVALELQRSVAAGTTGLTGKTAQPLPLAAAAKSAEVSPAFFERLTALGIVVPSDGDEPLFDQADIEIARIFSAFDTLLPDRLEDLGAIAELFGHIAERETRLRDRASRGMSAEQAAGLSGRFQQWANIWHAYLHSRLRLREIARHGLGDSERRESDDDHE